jgi:hypothetical protein
MEMLMRSSLNKGKETGESARYCSAGRGEVSKGGRRASRRGARKAGYAKAANARKGGGPRGDRRGVQ